jgi:hypothetical protein
MPIHGEKFHGLAKNFFFVAASEFFHPPISLRIETGRRTGSGSGLAPSLFACALGQAFYNHASLTTAFT